MFIAFFFLVHPLNFFSASNVQEIEVIIEEEDDDDDDDIVIIPNPDTIEEE